MQAAKFDDMIKCRRKLSHKPTIWVCFFLNHPFMVILGMVYCLWFKMDGKRLFIGIYKIITKYCLLFIIYHIIQYLSGCLKPCFWNPVEPIFSQLEQQETPLNNEIVLIDFGGLKCWHFIKRTLAPRNKCKVKFQNSDTLVVR